MSTRDTRANVGKRELGSEPRSGQATEVPKLAQHGDRSALTDANTDAGKTDEVYLCHDVARSRVRYGSRVSSERVTSY